MKFNQDRVDRIRTALRDAGLDAIVCSLPMNVLLLSGYWPVVGTGVAIATRDGEIAVVAPGDEEELARLGWADRIETFSPGSLDRITTTIDAVHEALKKMIEALGLERGRIGYEGSEVSQPASYVAMHLYGGSTPELLRFVAPRLTLVHADEILAGLRSVKTQYEIDRITLACRITGQAYEIGSSRLQAGISEIEAATRFRAPLSLCAVGQDEIQRADGHTFCMSGENSALAHFAYARSRSRIISRGDLVLLHCNSYADGYWTDVTRTYHIGDPDPRKRLMYDAVIEARASVLDAIRPGVSAAEVDAAARLTLAAHGFAENFRHQTGHGVGFAAIDHKAHPRIHPASDDMLEAGMVFNVEPSIYIDGVGGLRHCDVVAVTATGVEVLTPFQSSVGEMIVTGSE